MKKYSIFLPGAGVVVVALGGVGPATPGAPGRGFVAPVAKPALGFFGGPGLGPPTVGLGGGTLQRAKMGRQRPLMQ
jgi:hypothetical protein